MSIKKLILLLLLSYCPNWAMAQQPIYYNRTYDMYSIANNFAVTYPINDSVWLTPTTTYINGSGLIHYLFVDKNGDTLSSKHNGKNSHSYGLTSGQSLCKSFDQNYLLGGVDFDSTNGGDIFLQKISPVGDSLWTKTYGFPNTFENVNAVLEYTDGSLFLIGNSDHYNQGDVYVIKTNPNGDTLWTNHYGINSQDFAIGACIALNGHILISGNNITTNKTYILEIDTAGNTVWSRLLPYTSQYSFVTQLADSSLLLATGAIVSGLGYQAALVKLTASGADVWHYTYGTTENEIFTTVPLVSGNTITVGGGQWGSSYPKGLLMQFSDTGDSLLYALYSTPNTTDNYITDLLPTVDGGYLLTGYVFASSSDGWLLRLDSNGCEVPNCVLGIPEPVQTAAELLLYPNPSTGAFTVETSAATTTAPEVFDLLGNRITVGVEQVDNTHWLFSAEQLAPGIYLMRAKQHDGTMSTSRFILTR
jgi:Secretion system C-terminal sorting domain